MLNTAHQTLILCQRSFWLLQFVQHQLSEPAAGHWCGVGKPRWSNLSLRAQHRTAGVMETFGLFPQAKGVVFAVWDPSVGLVPAFVALQLLQYCFITMCHWNYPLKFLGTTKTAGTHFLCLKISLQILEILRLLQLSALLKNLCCVSKPKESFFFPSTHW